MIEEGIHGGTTQGKLYRFRHDCDECLYEAWERQQCGGGVGFVNPPGFYDALLFIAYNNNEPNPQNWGSFVRQR